MTKNNVIVVLLLVIIISCSSTKTKNNYTVKNETPPKNEINFIPYYLETERAKKLYDNKEYEKAYSIIDSLFNVYGVRNTFLVNECIMFLDMSVRLNKTNNLENVVKYKSSEMGFALVNFEDKERDFILKNTTIDSLTVDRYIKEYENGLLPVLQDTLKAMIRRDVEVRELYSSYDQNADAFAKVAALNDRQLVEIIKINGFPTVDQIEGVSCFPGILAMLMHLGTNEKIELQPILYEELKKGRIPPFMYALMLDKETMINQNDIGFPYYGTVDNRMPADTTACNNARETIGLPRMRFGKP